MIADADTGYGGLLNVRHTVRGYEQAGVTAIQLEDQEFPKKCGHTPDRRVIPIDDMVRKIKVAVGQPVERGFPDCGAHGCHAPARASTRRSSRGVAYGEAGADIIFVESPGDARPKWPKSASRIEQAAARQHRQWRADARAAGRQAEGARLFRCRSTRRSGFLSAGRSAATGL